MDKNFTDKLQAYMAIVQERKNLTWKDSKPEVQKIFSYTVSVKMAKRYAAISVKSGPQTSAHSFVEIETGDIFKPAGYKAPAKGVRGNIFTDPEKALDSRGDIRYLR